MKRVLIITYYWPPSGGSGVQRWVKFSKYLPAQGWQPVIYTPANPDIPPVDSILADDIPSEAEIIKRPITEFYSIYRRLVGAKSSASGEVNPINSSKKSLKQRLLMTVRGNFFIPDPRISWYRPSVKFLKKYLKEHPVDIIVSTGPPHSMHLIAKKVARETGIPWVADFRDPWTKLFYFKHLMLWKTSQKRHQLLEKQVLDGADAVVAVSPLVQDEFRQMTSSKVELITNGYDSEDFNTGPADDGYFNITHTGLFAADGDPDRLWKVLAKKCAEDEQFAQKLRIKLVGKNDREIVESIKAAGLEANLIDLGYQNHNKAVQEQINAHILILPLRKEPEYRATLPGKLFEYLASRRPILGIGQTDGAMAKIIDDANAGKVHDWDEEKGLESFIDEHWKAYLQGIRLSTTTNIEQYSRQSLTKKMASLFDTLLCHKV